MTCPVCNNVDCFIKEKSGYDIFKCESCGVEYTNPMPTEQQLFDFYSNYNDIRALEKVTRRNAIQNSVQLVDYYIIKERSYILDYGAGKGIFSDVCQLNGFKNAYSFDKYSDPYNNLSWEQCCNIEWDVVTSWGTVEHLTDLQTEFSKIQKLVKDNGFFVFTTVSIENEIPYRHKPPEHTFYFTRKSIELLAGNNEFELIEYKPYNMWQCRDVYMSILLRTVPEQYKELITYNLPEFVYIPTNEVFVVLRKK